jgi:hypothetical protein
MNRTYVVHYETESHIGFVTIQYGELTSLKRMCKERGHKITEIEYLVNGVVVDIKKF